MPIKRKRFTTKDIPVGSIVEIFNGTLPHYCNRRITEIVFESNERGHKGYISVCDDKEPIGVRGIGIPVERVTKIVRKGQ